MVDLTVKVAGAVVVGEEGGASCEAGSTEEGAARGHIAASGCP